MPRSFSFSHKQFVIVLLGSSLLVAAAAASVVWWRAHRVLEESAAATLASGSLKFTLQPLKPHGGPAGFAAFNAGGEFQSMAMFEGDLYVSSRSTLYRYARDGKLTQTWHTGQELPPDPLGALVVRRGIAQPELWIATDGAGALIWDGSFFRNLLPQNTKLRKLTALLPLNSGRMLLGTLDAGLYATDGNQLTLFHPQFLNAHITALAGGLAGREDDIWVGTRGEGAWLWRAGTVSRHQSELPDPQVLSIWSSDGTTWIGTPAGVAEFADGQFRRCVAEGIFARALVETGGTLWMGTLDEGTFSIDLKARTPRPSGGNALSGRAPMNAAAFLLDAGQVWAMSNVEVRRLPAGDEIAAAPPSRLASEHIASLYVDSGHRLWIGYFDRGLDVTPGNGDDPANHFEDDVLFCINRIKQNPADGRVFVATANGLAIFDSSGRPRQILTALDGLISNNVTDLLFRQQPGGVSTVIATPAGLTFVDGHAMSSVYAFQGLVNNHVYTLAESGETLLAGTLGGVSFLKDGLVQASFTTANSALRQNWITASAVSGADLYLGTYGSGVIRVNGRFDIQAFREFAGQRIEINQNAMLATSSGIFAGTAGRGLAFLPLGESRWRFLQDGLPSTNVTALAIDGENLYVGTDNGLVRISERALHP